MYVPCYQLLIKCSVNQLYVLHIMIILSKCNGECRSSVCDRKKIGPRSGNAVIIHNRNFYFLHMRRYLLIMKWNIRTARIPQFLLQIQQRTVRVKVNKEKEYLKIVIINKKTIEKNISISFKPIIDKHFRAENGNSQTLNVKDVLLGILQEEIRATMKKINRINNNGENLNQSSLTIWQCVSGRKVEYRKNKMKPKKNWPNWNSSNFPQDFNSNL